ncbi:MAG TPA: hypothetical protein VIW69_10020 [Candidatus Elarobacter sp.]
MGPLGLVPIAAPTPTAAPPAVSSSAGTVSASGPTTIMLPPAAGGISGSMLLTAASTTATIALTLSATPPNGAPSLQSDRRVVRTIGGSAISLAYLTAQSSADVTFNSTFGANIVVPGPVNGPEYLVLYDPANPSTGWTVVGGPGNAAVGIAGGLGRLVVSFTKGATYYFALISTQSTLTLQSPTPSPSPSSSPTATPAPTSSPSPSPSPTPAPSPTPSPTPTPVPPPSPSPTATPSPAMVAVNVPSLQFVGTGPAFATTITVTQAGYNGQFVLSGTSCSTIATTDTTASQQNFTITPLAAGTCSYTLTGGGGAHTTVPVAVTTTTATITIP